MEHISICHSLLKRKKTKDKKRTISEEKYCRRWNIDCLRYGAKVFLWKTKWITVNLKPVCIHTRYMMELDEHFYYVLIQQNQKLDSNNYLFTIGLVKGSKWNWPIVKVSFFHLDSNKLHVSLQINQNLVLPAYDVLLA